MTNVTIKTSSQKLITWGSILLIAPIVGIVIIFFGWTLLNLINNVLLGGAEASPEDPIETIVTFIKGILTLSGLLCTIWGLSLSPVGIILIIVGLVKRGEKQ